LKTCHRPNKRSPVALAMEFVLSPSLGAPQMWTRTLRNPHASDLPESCNTFWNVEDFTMAKAEHLEHRTRNSVITTTLLELSSACMPNLGSCPLVLETKFMFCARTFTFASTRTGSVVLTRRTPSTSGNGQSGDSPRHHLLR
jgi:hypothetical protein